MSQRQRAKTDTQWWCGSEAARGAAERLEDLTWMADTGESASGAARRLGIGRSALEVWCRRHAPEVWARLAARDPVDHNYRSRHKGERKTA